MSERITNRISLCSMVALSFLGVASNECLAGGSDCTTGSIVKVCVAWSQQADPDPEFDYLVTFSNPSAPDVELSEPDLGWVVYATLVSSPGTAADLGAVTTPGADNYQVTIDNPAFAGPSGADDVGSLVLQPSGDNHSSIGTGSHITGDLSGALTVEEDSSGAGGTVKLTIDGDANGALTIPKVESLNILGNTSGVITIAEIAPNGKFEIGELTQKPPAPGAG